VKALWAGALSPSGAHQAAFVLGKDFLGRDPEGDGAQIIALGWIHSPPLAGAG